MKTSPWTLCVWFISPHANCWNSSISLWAAAGPHFVNILQMIYWFCHWWAMSYFQFRAVTNSTAMHILICVFWWHTICWEETLESLSYRVCKVSALAKSVKRVFTMTALIHVPTVVLSALEIFHLCSWVFLVGVGIKSWICAFHFLSFGQRSMCSVIIGQHEAQLLFLFVPLFMSLL